VSERQSLTPANAEVVARLCGAEPVLVDVQPAGKALPGMTGHTVLTSGPPLPWREYFGGQRAAIIGGALYEGLATDAADADRKLTDGRIRLGACHDHGCVGSLAGIYTASMPVLVVENRAGGSRGHCNLFEGPSPARLNYGVYNDQVRQSLVNLRDVIGPLLGEAIRGAGGVPLRPIMRRALHMGDELHSRNAAATLLLGRELSPAILALAARQPEAARQLLGYLGSDYVFLRVSMAASKATAEAGHGVEGSSVVSAMAFSCREFGIRVSGLGDTWFRAPMPKVEGKFFPGFTVEDVEYMGGESVINETVGLGGFAQAAAFALQEYQGGSPEEMVAANLAMYRITLAEHPELKIPFLGFRGVPVGIEVQRVMDTRIVPVMDIGLAGRKGGQIGAGLLRAPLECFRAAADALARRPRPSASHPATEQRR